MAKLEFFITEGKKVKPPYKPRHPDPDDPPVRVLIVGRGLFVADESVRIDAGVGCDVREHFVTQAHFPEPPHVEVTEDDIRAVNTGGLPRGDANEPGEFGNEAAISSIWKHRLGRAVGAVDWIEIKTRQLVEERKLDVDDARQQASEEAVHEFDL